MKTLLRWCDLLRTRFSSLWKKADQAHRALLGGIVLAALLGAAWIVSWSLRPDYEVLFSGLSPQNATLILDELSQAGARSRVSENGRTVLVESSRLGEMRIRVASKGLTGEHPVGYEIFDYTAAKRNEFLEQVSYRRALEVELARTVSSLEEVEQARVHLAMGETKTASLILELRPGTRLGSDQVRGIRALIAASVEGLQPEGVSLLDSSGRLLGDSGLADGLGVTSDQLRVQQEVEGVLREKAASILERAVGPQGAVVQVTAALNFNRIERNVETYNPSTTSLRTEQRIADPNSDASENTILSSYEIDKTVEHILGEVGSIQRLSIAVLVNGIETENASGDIVYAERSVQELEKLAAMVRSAIGFTEERGDVLEIANLRFADPESQNAAAFPMPWWLFFPSLGSHWNSLVNLLAIGLVAWGLRHSSMVLVRAIQEDRSRRNPTDATGADDSSETPLHSGGIRRQVNELANERPSEVASIVRQWLVEENAP